jgi:hypothetical protein
MVIERWNMVADLVRVAARYPTLTFGNAGLAPVGLSWMAEIRIG